MAEIASVVIVVAILEGSKLASGEIKLVPRKMGETLVGIEA
jgi:hypothetical protein